MYRMNFWLFAVDIFQPKNILLKYREENADVSHFHVKISDFGLSLHEQESFKGKKEEGATFYVSPEQWRGQPCDVKVESVLGFRLLA